MHVRFPGRALVVALAFAAGAPLPGDAIRDARADEATAADAFRRAELAERAAGDLDRAAHLYLESAREAVTAAARAVAEIRAASCLRRLGRHDAARALVVTWTAPRDDVPADVRRAAASETAALDAPGAAPGTAAGAPESPDARLAEKERELEQMRQELESILARVHGYETTLRGNEAQITDLARRVREKDAELAKARAEAAPAAPTTAEEVLAIRRRQLERERQSARQLAAMFVTTARLLQNEGRFAEARTFLYDALERDAENAEAKALLPLVSAPLGHRQALFQRAMELAALAREVRNERRAAEISELADEGRRRQARGDFAGAAAPLERALAAVDAFPGAMRGPALRDEIVRLLAEGTSRGVARAPATAPPADAQEDRWTGALRELLADAGREVAQGLELRFHDLAAVASSGGLPPIPHRAEPTGWTISTVDVATAPLAAAWVRATEPRALATPGATMALVGSTCAVLADLAAQSRIADRLATLRVGAAPASDVQIVAYRVEHSAVGGALAARGVATATLPGGALAASLDPADLDALTASLAGTATGVVGGASLRATPLRGFRLSAGPVSSRLVIDAMTVPGARPGIGMRVGVSWAPQSDDARVALAAEALAGASVLPGGGLVVFGVPDPERPGNDIAVVARVGAAPAAATATAPLPPPAPEQGADEIRIPAVVASAEDPPAPPLLVPDHPPEPRNAAMLRRIETAGSRAQSVELRGDRVLVVGSDAARAAVASEVARLAAASGPVRLDVRFHQVAPGAQNGLAALCPRSDRVASGGFRWTVLASGRESRDLEFFLRRADGEIALPDTVVAAPPTVRADQARLSRSPFRNSPGTSDGGTAWGRGDAVWVEEGLVVSLRQFGRRADGRIDLDVGARARWVADAGRRDARTPLGSVPVHEPRTESWWGDVTTGLGAGETIVLWAARSPFSGIADEQVVVTVRLAE